MAPLRVITPSLMSKAHEAFHGSSRGVRELKRSLAREEGERSRAMEFGITFENLVYNYAAKNESSKNQVFNRVVERFKGGVFQVPLRKDIEVRNKLWTIFGFADAIFEPDTIVDLKTTGRKNEARYMNSYQHNFYCYGLDMTLFEYYIVEYKLDPFTDRETLIDTTRLTISLEPKENEATVITAIEIFDEVISCNNLESLHIGYSEKSRANTIKPNV